jgi:hypothetical protein
MRATAAIAVLLAACGDDVPGAVILLGDTPPSLDDLRIDGAGRAIAVDDELFLDQPYPVVFWIRDGAVWRELARFEDGYLTGRLSAADSDDVLAVVHHWGGDAYSEIGRVTYDGIEPLATFDGIAIAPRIHDGELIVVGSETTYFRHVDGAWSEIAELRGWLRAVRGIDGAWYGVTDDDGEIRRWRPGSAPERIASCDCGTPRIAGIDAGGTLIILTDSVSDPDGSTGIRVSTLAPGDGVLVERAVYPDWSYRWYVSPSGQLVATTIADGHPTLGELIRLDADDRDFVRIADVEQPIALAHDREADALYLLEDGRLSRVIH